MVSFNHKNGSFEPFLIYNSSMSFFSPKSLKILIFRHEIAILFLVAVMGTAYFIMAVATGIWNWIRGKK